MISSTAAFHEFDFPNCSREKLQNKLPPPKIQSPEMSDSGDLDHDHDDPGGDDDLQPLDHDQPETPPPRAKSHHGPPDVDTKDDDEDLYGLHIRILARPSLPWMLPHPPNPQGGTSTGGARQRSPPAPIVPPQPPQPPQPPLPSRKPPAPRKPSMGYGKEHPRMPITPYTRLQRTIRPVVRKDSAYGDRTPVQIKQEIRTEKNFVQKILRQGFELPQPISRTHLEPTPSGSHWTELRNNPMTGNSSEEESEPSPMREDSNGEKSDKHANKVEWSSAFISELMAHAAESSDVPRLYHNIKKKPVEDQENWLKACDEEMKSLAD